MRSSSCLFHEPKSVVPTFFRPTGPSLQPGSGPPTSPAACEHNVFIHRICLSCTGKHGGPWRGVVGHCTGTKFLIQVLLFSIMWPWAFPFPSWSLRFLICQSGPDGEAPPRLGIVIPLTSVRVLCLHSTFAFFLGREACVYTLPQSRASHRQACRGAVVLLGGREGAHVSCVPLLCSKPLATITSFHPGHCPLWQLVLLSSFHRRGN